MLFGKVKIRYLTVFQSINNFSSIVNNILNMNKTAILPG